MLCFTHCTPEARGCLQGNLFRHKGLVALCDDGVDGGIQVPREDHLVFGDIGRFVVSTGGLANLDTAQLTDKHFDLTVNVAGTASGSPETSFQRNRSRNPHSSSRSTPATCVLTLGPAATVDLRLRYPPSYRGLRQVRISRHPRDRSITLPVKFHHVRLEGWCERPPPSSLLHRLLQG